MKVTKEEFHDEIRHYLLPLGDNVAAAVTRNVDGPQELMESCSQLGLATFRDHHMQIQILRRHVESVGVAAFLRKWAQAVANRAPKDKGDTSYQPRLKIHAPSDEEAARWTQPRYANYEPGDASRQPSQEPSATAAKSAPDSPATPPCKPGPEWDKIPENLRHMRPLPAPYNTWPYIDRRSGKERRSGKDRRANVETIFKNKRFGGDRRSGKDRRKNWKPTEPS